MECWYLLRQRIFLEGVVGEGEEAETVLGESFPTYNESSPR